MITENLLTLKIHKLTKEQYDRELTAGNIDETALYLTPEEEIDLSGYATVDKLNTKADADHNHNDLYYTETEVDTLLSNKANTNHNHDTAYDTKGSADTALASAKSYTDTKTSSLAPTTVVDNKISTHNTSTSAHNDIRNLISGLTTRLNTLADSDDTTLDQMSEIVEYIKSNKTLIDSVTTSKVNVSDIVNNLTTNVTNKPLSAAQGVVIKALIDALQSELDSHTHAISDVSGLQSALDGKSGTGHTHNYAGSSSVGGSANSAVKVNNSLTLKLNGGTTENTNMFTFNGSTTKAVNITPSVLGAIANNVFTGGGTSGTQGYVAFAQLKITSTYTSQPIEFELICRGKQTPCYVSIAFSNNYSTDPTLSSLKYWGTDYGVFAVKSTTSTWLLYYTKSDGYDSVTLARTQSASQGITITYPGTFITTKPTSGVTNASLGGSIGNADTATKAIQDASGNVITSTYETKTNVSSHTGNKSNPHAVTKSQVGLGNVPNVSTNDQTPTFSQAYYRANIASGEKLSVIFGKIMKYFADLKTVAFTGSYNDLSNKPTIPSAYAHPSYTARTGVPTGNQAPGFGGTFTVTQPVSDGTGHITAMNSRTITIPNAVATTSANGLMSSSDKTKLNNAAQVVEVTQAQYNSLGSVVNTNGIFYLVK